MERVLKDGPQSLALSFDNDYYNKDVPAGTTADRNAFVLSMTIEGPLEPNRIPAWRSVMDAYAAHADRSDVAMAEQRWLRSQHMAKSSTAQCAATQAAHLRRGGPRPRR